MQVDYEVNLLNKVSYNFVHKGGSKMGRLKNIGRGIFVGFLNNILGIILPFISRTIIIHQLGTEYVGLGSLFTSILQVLSLSELGFGVAIGYLLYKPLAEGDRAKVNAILRFYRKIYLIIGILILVISTILYPFLDKLIAGDVPANINIHVLYIIYVVNTAISYFFFSYKKILLSANQRYDIEVGITSCVFAIKSIVQISLLLVFRNYYVYVIVIPVMTLLGDIVAYVTTNKKFPGYVCEGRLNQKDIRDILKNTGGAFFSKIGSTVYLSVDNIIISAFLGLSILGKYNNYYYVISSLIAVFAVIHNSIRPAVGNIMVTENKEAIWSIFTKTNYIYMLFVILCSNCCYVLFQDFEQVWCGSDNMLGFDIVILLVIYFFVGRITSLLSVYLEAAGILWQGKFVPLASALVNLLLNIVLVNISGLRGVLISSIISLLFINLPGYTHIVFKYLFTDKRQRHHFFKDTIILIVQMIIIILICTITVKNINVDTWGDLLIKGAITSLVVGVVIFVLNIRNTYFKELFQQLKCYSHAR